MTIHYFHLEVPTALERRDETGGEARPGPGPVEEGWIRLPRSLRLHSTATGERVRCHELRRRNERGMALPRCHGVRFIPFEEDGPGTPDPGAQHPHDPSRPPA